MRRFMFAAKTLLPLVYAQKWRVVGAYALTLTGVALALCLPWPLSYLIDNVLGDHGGPLWLAALSKPQQVLALATAMGLLAIASASVLAFEKVVHARVREQFGLRLRESLMQIVYGLSLQSRQRERSGELTMRLVSDSQLVGRLFCRTVPTLAKDLVMAFALLVATLLIDVRIGAVAVAMAVVLLLVFRHFGPKVSAASRQRRQLEGRVAALTQESVAGIEHIQSMALEDQARRRYLTEIRGSLGAGMREVEEAVRLERAAQVLSGFAVALVAGLGGYLVVSEAISLGTLTVCIAYMTQLLKPIEKVNETATSISSGLVRVERVMALLEAELSAPTSGVNRADLKLHEIRCVDVDYRYPGTTQPAVLGFSDVFRVGECVALVGPSGSGKSTILRLILRLIEPTRGTIVADGSAPYTDLDPFALRANFAVLLQMPHLFSGALRDVVAELEPAATDEEILAVLDDVRLRDLVTTLPEGLDTRLDEAGARLSGGQRARLLLARALLAKRTVLILDEPFANIDDVSKTIILEALRRAKRHRLMIVVSHEQRLLSIADRVLTPQNWCRKPALEAANVGND
jgi:ATP-binding cassette, subfamily B, bacterial